MPPKRKLTATEQERLLQQFYDELDDDTFLGHSLEGEDDIPPDDDSSESDSSGECEIDMGLDEDVPVDDIVDNPPRKQLFSNLDDVLNLDNYEQLPEQEYALFEYQNSSKTLTMQWETQNPQNRNRSGRLSNRNIIRNKPGPRSAAKIVSNPLEAFSLFIPDELLDTIVQHTNDNIGHFYTLYPFLPEYSYAKFVDLIDIKAYFGLMYFRGSLKQNLFSSRHVWYHESANDVFAATMTLNRFGFISRVIEFDDKSTRNERWNYDKFACVREFFEQVNKNNARYRSPSPYLAVDETLYPYRGHIGFRQYNPSKPAKYGLLYRSLCDSSVPYTYFTLPYAGKPEEINGEGSSFYVTGTDEYTKYLVQGFSNHNSIRGCNISMDRYFTSVSIAEWATENNFTVVGTMRLDRKGIPAEIKKMDDREEKSTLYVHEKDGEKTLVSYVDKKKSGKKNIIVLSTMHASVRVTKDERRKPNIHTFYDYTKGGVDVVDLVSSHNTTKMKVKRWPLNALAFILDTVRTNAKTILGESANPSILSSFEFTYQLGKLLVIPNIQRRYENNQGFKNELNQKMRRILGFAELDNVPRTSTSTVGRCKVCVHNIVGKPDYKEKREKLNNKLKSKCEKCSDYLCKNHTKAVCEICFGKDN